MLKLKINSYEGKTIDDALNKALGELNASKEEVYYKDEEIAGGLFKSKKYVVKVMLKEDVLEYIKAYLKEVTELMGIKVELETLKKETYIKVNMLSDNSSILIGKNGRTMSSLQNLLRQSIYSKSGIKVNVILDANEYKEKQEKNIERLAVKLAKDVVKTGIEVKMDRMNSYERRLVHNRLSNFKGVTTISEGEEPNRCVVIKPVEK